MTVAIIIAILLMLAMVNFFWHWVIAPFLIIGAAVLAGFLLRRVLSDLVFGPRP